MKIKLIVTVFLLIASLGAAQTPSRPDNWGPLRHLVGKWEGTGNGQPGVSKAQREYRLVLNDKFLHLESRSVYDPQPKNPKGGIHEDWGMISFDKSRKQLVLRQFHVSTYINGGWNTRARDSAHLFSIDWFGIRSCSAS